MVISSKAQKNGFRVLAKQNQKHHVAAVRAIPRSALIKTRLMKSRKNYLTELSKRKGLEWIKERISLPEVNGKKGYEVISSGAGRVFVKYKDSSKTVRPFRVAFVTDNLGRIRFFFKKEGIQYMGAWDEIRHFRVIDVAKGIIEAKKFEGFASEVPEAYDLSAHLNHTQNKMSFSKKNAMRNLILLRRLL